MAASGTDLHNSNSILGRNVNKASSVLLSHVTKM